ncbi:unnamed protein product [Rotaria socialis]|uniref:OTU domain-containing protein n=1 Tax=Rotaria socialis TaxID=392032 RepID=A0A820PMV8_9BILA|nr:unnamed protein product [Rotaria socialis]
MSRGQKFARLLQYLETCSKSVMHQDAIVSAVQSIRQIETIMTPIQFHPNQVFDETKHIVDVIAKKYLEKATDDVHKLVPVEVAADGNCLYSSILVLMNNPAATQSELRVRTIIELVMNEIHYTNTYSQFMGPVNIAVQAICKNCTFSEFEKDARETNHGGCSPNHFVPLMSPAMDYDFESSNESTSTIMKTLKNNVHTQIRIPEFESSPSRRLRTEMRPENDSAQSIISGQIKNQQDDIEPRHQSRLEKKREYARASRTNETDNEHQQRLEKQKSRSQLNRAMETEEQRQNRLQNDRERTRSSRRHETEEQRQNRLKKNRERTQSSRRNETEQQRQNRLKIDRERAGSTRMNKTEEQRQNRIEQQRKRSQVNRTKKKLEKRTSHNTAVQHQDILMQLNETEDHAPLRGNSMNDLTQNENVTKKNKSSIYPRWPESISHDLKEACLKQFLKHMSMSALAEATCAVCNVRIPVQNSKKILVSKIPNIHVLKVSDELNELVGSMQSAARKHSITNIGVSAKCNNIQMAGHVQDSSNFNSPSFYCKNGIILYTNGLYQQNRADMCTICKKCHDSLSKGHIPKFSPANNMWLGDVPTELQGLTIPEEKLISLYRHNSCIIKLHSPFHSTTTAQTALKGNCITFLQNVPNIVSSLPLTLDDLCDIVKVVFVGAQRPERLHLKKF